MLAAEVERRVKVACGLRLDSTVILPQEAEGEDTHLPVLMARVQVECHQVLEDPVKQDL